MNLRIIFCDDDPIFTNQMKQLVAEYFSKISDITPSYVSYNNGDELIESEENGDIAFLDVEMPGQSGIHVGAKLKERNPRIKIIIVTSYADYLDEAMRFQVFRYLSKPIDKNRLFRNIKDAVKQLVIDTTPIIVETADGYETLLSEDIMCICADGRRSIVYTNNRDIDSVKGIEYWKERIITPCFYHTHRSFIVNMKYVSSFNKDTVVLRSHNKRINAYLASRRLKEFKNAYLLYMESMK